MLDVSFRYDFGGKTYKLRKTFAKENHFQIGGIVEIVIDSKHPRRCYQKSQFYK